MTAATCITKDDEGLLALGCEGNPFNSYAARELLSGRRLKRELAQNGALFYILLSCFSRRDRRGARQFLVDWTDEYAKPVCPISRFVPGDHYYALDTKFDTYEQASEHIKRSGGRVGTTIVHRTPREGD